MFLMISQPNGPLKKNQIMHSQLINMQNILLLKIYIIYSYIYMPQNIYIDLV
jgi:uncharacterized protein (DUF486 family)